jgi:hypothetical protein
MPTRNPTGFDINEFKAAASPSSVWAKKDPWARQYVNIRFCVLFCRTDLSPSAARLGDTPALSLDGTASRGCSLA